MACHPFVANHRNASGAIAPLDLIANRRPKLFIDLGHFVLVLKLVKGWKTLVCDSASHRVPRYYDRRGLRTRNAGAFCFEGFTSAL